MQAISCKKCNNSTVNFICDYCGYLNPINNDVDYFSYLNIQQSLQLDFDVLETHYLQAMQICHPDNFVRKEEAEKINALAHSSYVNTAYNTLLDTTSRFLYLYKLINNEDLIKEDSSTDDSKLMLYFLEYYEALDEIKSADELQAFQKQLKDFQTNIVREANSIDFSDKSQAMYIFIKLRYTDRILAKSLIKKI